MKCWNTRPLTSKQCIDVPYFVVPFQRFQRFSLFQLLCWQCVLQDLIQSQYRFHKPLTSCSPTKRNLGRSGERAGQAVGPLVPIQRTPNPSWQCNTGVSGFLTFFTYLFFYNEVRFVFCLSVKYLINTENYVTQKDLFAHIGLASVLGNCPWTEFQWVSPG